VRITHLSISHTGAGLSDATFVKDTPLPAHRGWFNGTALNWFEPTANNTIYFGVELAYLAPYSQWAPVQINGGQQDGQGLSLTADNKLAVTSAAGSSSSFVAWLGKNSTQ
jgi:hypothetical protein